MRFIPVHNKKKLARLDEYFVRYFDFCVNCYGIDGVPSQILALMSA